tara:strand:- start:48 stop:227 length:180 start_codon:yes stop_codon:yes gene_type:complete
VWWDNTLLTKKEQLTVMDVQAVDMQAPSGHYRVLLVQVVLSVLQIKKVLIVQQVNMENH